MCDLQHNLARAQFPHHGFREAALGPGQQHTASGAHRVLAHQMSTTALIIVIITIMILPLHFSFYLNVPNHDLAEPINTF